MKIAYMLIGLVGLPNKGKSTLFNALTKGNAQVANYPFTTIAPNQGAAFASTPCPHVELKLEKCDPNNSACEKGVRKIPVRLLDVAGLVEGAHEGKGMGNQFLNDLSSADALIVVCDAAGLTDDAGNPTTGHDPASDVRILESELDAWFLGVVDNNAKKARGRTMKEFAALLSGLKVSENDVLHLVEGLPPDTARWTKEDKKGFASALRKKTKPLVVAANKIDLPHKLETLEPLGYPVFPVSADAAWAKIKALEKGLAEEKDGKLVAKTDNPTLQKAIDRLNQTDDGVQALMDHVVFDVLGQIALYPVEDETHFSNHFGKVLPDAFLLTQGATPVDLAGKIHTDLAKGFLHAVDCKARRRVGKDHVLKNGDVVKIVSAR